MSKVPAPARFPRIEPVMASARVICSEGCLNIDGFGREWVEERVLVLGITFIDAMACAKEYEQNAFVWTYIDCIPSLVVRI